ncbi:MAG: hypothetical protein AAGA87_05820 [Pseudomonadota bacterium]
MSASQAVALPNSASEQAQVFAGCAGRYSAEAEHARMFDGVTSEEAEARRDLFLTLLDAVMPDANVVAEHMPMAWRIDAKAAHAALLATSVFGMYPERSARADELAKTYIARCDRLILPV